MNRANLVRLVFLVLLGAAPAAGQAQQPLEIISLRHRTVEEVLPALRPLLEPGATLSGMRGQVFVRTSPTNLAEIRRALDAIDRPSRRLQISVRYDDAAAAQRRELGASGVISSSGSRVTITAEDARSGSAERVDQRMQVMEGGRAYIFAGQSRPLGGETQDIATGFEVTPRVSGDRVVLEIATQKESPGGRPGTVQGQRAVSTVSARLGEWAEISGTSSQLANEGRASVRAAESRRVWLKVEEVK
jgi:hypothetical protein